MKDTKSTEDYIADWEIERLEAWEDITKLHMELTCTDDPNVNKLKLKRQIKEREEYMKHASDMIYELERA